MRILAIDPGFERLGIAILEKDLIKRDREIVIYSACFNTSPRLDFYVRLSAIGQEVNRVIETYKPERLAIEKLFFSTNKTTAMKVSEARGVIIYEAARHGLLIYEYNPADIKIAVTGFGRADKTAVMNMVHNLVTLPEGHWSDDELDAIAIGLTHFSIER